MTGDMEQAPCRAVDFYSVCQYIRKKTEKLCPAASASEDSV